MFKLIRSNSLVKKIGSLIFLVVILQGLFVLLSVFITNIPGTMENFSYGLFAETVNTRKNNITNDMVSKWSDISTFKDEIEINYNNSVSTSNFNEDDFLYFFDSSVETLINMVIETGTTGGFIILNDSTRDNISHSALYISNSNYSSSIDENSTIHLVSGSSDISKEYKIPLSNAWSYGLTFNESNKNILDKTLEIVDLTDDERFWGYWDITTSFVNPDIKIMTYSLPIIDANNKPIGIVGIELTQDFLYKHLPFDEFSQVGSYGYTFAKKDKATNQLIPLMAQGTVQKSIYKVDEFLELEKLNISTDNIAYTPEMINTSVGEVAISYGKVDVYVPNTPFEDEALYLLGMTSVSNITRFSDNVVNLFLYLFVASLTFGGLIAYIIGYRFSIPIVSLSKQVVEHKSGKPVLFKKTNIKEIDELASSIVDLNKNILNSAYKMDNILNLLNIKVGSFEFVNKTDTVMISGQLRNLLNLPSSHEYDMTIKKDLFFETLNRLKENKEEEFEDVYLISDSNEKWYRITETIGSNVHLGVIMDVTKEILETRALNYQRDYDMLTGIYNRAAFHRKASQILSKVDLKITAFVMFDLDNLKYVNDTYGHSLGDTYIKSAAELLSSSLSENGLVGRMSGDEFYVLLFGYNSKDDLLNDLTNFYKRLNSEPILLPDTKEFKIRMSGGIAWYGYDSNELDELIRFADFAMYEGKFTLKGELREFNKNAYLEKSFMLSGKEELNRILDNEFVDFVFQPIINARTGAIYAYEALMRPQSTIIDSPLKLIQIATAQSQLWKIEKITFFKTLSLYKKNNKMFNGAKLFINSIPNKTLRENEFQEFEKLYKEYLSNIVVEIIETEQFSDDSLKIKLDRIHSWNALVALDDYGSGYNNDIGLLNLKPNIVKLDRSLITNIESDASRQAIVAKIVSFCKGEGIYILAEGVETLAQMQYLISLDIDFLQGYYVSRPLPEANFDNTKIVKEIENFYGNKEK